MWYCVVFAYICDIKSFFSFSFLISWLVLIYQFFVFVFNNLFSPVLFCAFGLIAFTIVFCLLFFRSCVVGYDGNMIFFKLPDKGMVMMIRGSPDGKCYY
jgi:hypothetical protein